jgi:ring-1,2-phenylacetyl-CoA epoxidase subunit PaaE
VALHFYPLTVSDVRQETPDCVSIAFTIPELLKKEFDFIQGQNITIKTNLDDVRRSYSICSSPMQNELRVAVKKVNNGIFSTYATEKLQPGDVLEVMSPTGTFYTEIKQEQKKDYLFFAAGSGITPVISIIKTILSTEKESQVTLVYGNKNISSIIFREELEALKNQHLENLNVIHILSREKTEADLNTGRIDVNKCKELSRLFNWKSIDEFFICGPEAMIFSVKDYLEQEGVAKEKIHFELFTTPTKKHTQIYEAVDQPEKSGCAVTVKVDGRSYDFDLEYNGNTILEEGLSHGIDLPFACKGGVCCSCKAKLLEGKVEMEANYGLEDSEVKDGYILTCQSHPRTTRVIVDYDV